MVYSTLFLMDFFYETFLTSSQIMSHFWTLLHQNSDCVCDVLCFFVFFHVPNHICIILPLLLYHTVVIIITIHYASVSPTYHNSMKDNLKILCLLILSNKPCIHVSSMNPLFESNQTLDCMKYCTVGLFWYVVYPIVMHNLFRPQCD